MNRFTFVLLTTFTVAFFTTLVGCSDQEIENKSASSETTQQASEADNPAQTESSESDNVIMDHGSMEHEAGNHGEDAAHEEQEGMAHEHGEHMGMQGDSHWNAPSAVATLINPVTADTASVKRGRDLFLNNCASCHGNSARGDGPIALALTPKPADLVVMAPMHPAEDFFWKIGNGRGAMPAWKNTLSENQIWDLVNYIKSLGKTEPSENEDHESDGHNHAH